MAIGPVDTALGLHALGTDVTIFAEHDMELPARTRHLADCIVTLAPPRVDLPPALGAALFLARRLDLGRRWAHALRRHPVDVVHAFSPGTVVPLPRTLPVVVQAWYHPARSTLRGRLNRTSAYGTAGVDPRLQAAAHVTYQAQTYASDALGYRRGDLLLTATPSAARFYADRGRPAACIPPCIEVAAAVLPRARGDAFRIAFCAHPLDRSWKGLRYLLEALAAAPPDGPVELTLVGGWGRRPDALVDAVERAGVRVQATGQVERDAYLEHLATEADVLVAPALWEEWGYSLFEALSRGVPVIAFDTYPYTETIDASLGMLVPPRDPDALARAIAAARDGALPARERVLESARERFGSRAIAAALVDAYERTCSSRRRTVRASSA